ncbi:S-layer homology domain-containing protein [Paenibacillus dokdonensis]|uniref:S-layer homology domain-containing protein n=1 Tax=Paenibacillus dokdonensis TaxID=2567944 RepID=A0ABU6GEZ4_9BACL|nr:S-layer homology domain-containing protein [Paenibacillus dokdonensis]MEC0238309.1 S-layer homology domain-containing protein [Paenibacillus dokdonensis]
MVRGKIIGGKRVKFSLMVMLCFTIIVSLLGPLMNAAQVYAAAGFSGGDGTVGNPYIVTTPEQLDAIRNNLGANYKLGNNIDLTAYLAQDGGGYNDGKFWRPIAEFVFQTFYGTFDGDGYVIRGLKINSAASQNNVGFFGTASMGATIKNIGLENVVVTSGSFVGGLVGVLQGPSTTISNSYVTGSVSGANYIGGLVGYQRDSSISNSYSSVKVTGSFAGGLVGYKDTSSVSTSYATGLVSGFNSGGLVGASPTGTVTDSFYDKSTTGGYDSGKGTPITTLEMQTQSTFGSAWDFASVWYMPLNQYPQLRKFMTHTPVANPDPSGGSVALGSVVTLTSGTAGASIYYTTNGEAPTTSSTLYSSPIILDDDLTIKAIAIATEKSDSEIMSKSYTITRAVAPTTGTLEMGTNSKTTKLNGVTDAMEYKVNSGVYKAITDTSVDNISVNAGDKIYVRIAATLQQPAASSAQELTVDLADIKPADVPSGTLTPGSNIGTTKLCGVTNAMEYSLDGEEYTLITTEPYADNINVNAGDTIYVRVAATVQQPASDVQELTVVQADIKQETTPVILSLTPGTNIGTTKLIGVTDVMEYKVNNDEYTKINSATVDNISVTAGDTIYVRIAATSEEPASEAQELIVAQGDIKTADEISATLTSTIGTVSKGGTADETITDIPYGTTVAEFKAAITVAEHAAFEIYDGDGTTVATELVTGSKVIVTDEDGIIMATYTVTVNAPSPVVTSVHVSPATANVVQGATKQLTATVTVMGGAAQTVEWASSNAQVSVSTNGLVTVAANAAPGDYTITATSTVDAGKKGIATIRVTSAEGSGTGTGSGSGTGTGSGSGTPAVTPVPTPVPTPIPTPTPEPAQPSVDVFKSDVVNGTNLVNAIESRVAEANKSTIENEFTDVKGHWAEKNINTFVKLKFIEGNGDGKFNPNGNITRAEFAAIISRVFDISGAAGHSVTLSDVGNHWAKDAIEKLTSAGILNGYGDGAFKPNQTISREEIVIILSRIVNLDHVNKNAAKGNFTDMASASSYAAGSIKDAAEAGIIDGKNSGTFDPQGYATRAEALTVILNVLNLNPQIKTILNGLN